MVPSIKADKKALRKSFYATLAKLISVFLGAGAGSVIHNLIGDSLATIGVAVLMAIAALVLMWFAEYHHEVD